MMREVSGSATPLRSAPLDWQAATPEELDVFSPPAERIALVKLASSYDHEVMRMMQLLDSMLWAFKKTTRPAWAAGTTDDADITDHADVIVVHQDEPGVGAATNEDGRVVVEIVTRCESDPTASYALVINPQNAQLLIQLKRKDAELPAPAQVAPPAAEVAKTSSPGAGEPNPWSFVELLRTLRAREGSDSWLVARDGDTPFFWVRGDAAHYVAAAPIVQAIRNGTLDLSRLELQDGPPPPEGSNLRYGAELSWFAGYYASHELAPWLDCTARYRVASRPNFAFIRPLPSQLRVANAFAWAPADAGQLAARATITVEDAVRILNAMATCDMMLPAEPEAAAAPVPAEPRAGLIAMLRRYLGKHLAAGIEALSPVSH